MSSMIGRASAAGSIFARVRRRYSSLYSGGHHDRRERLASVTCCNVFSGRSEEHTSELQSLMRISYAVFCLKKKKKKRHHIQFNKPAHRLFVTNQHYNTKNK